MPACSSSLIDFTRSLTVVDEMIRSPAKPCAWTWALKLYFISPVGRSSLVMLVLDMPRSRDIPTGSQQVAPLVCYRQSFPSHLPSNHDRCSYRGSCRSWFFIRLQSTTSIQTHA